MQDNSAKQLEPWTQVPFLPGGSPPLSPSSSPQARPEHLRSARGLSMEPGPLYRLTHQVLLRSKVRDVPQEGFTSQDNTHNSREEQRAQQSKATPFHEIPDELEENSAKGSTTYQQKRGLILLSQDLWIAREPVEGSLEGLDSHPHNRPHHHAYQCHYELPV